MRFAFSDVAVVVSDAQASAKWWKQKCGFDVKSNAGHWVTIAAPGTDVEVHLCAGEGYAMDAGNTGIGWLVDDIFATHKKWSAKGVRFPKPPVQESASVNARFADPDGNEFWLFEDHDLRPKPKPRAKKAAKKPARKASKTPRRR
jgi:catechol 2,3-dioxygenase-like lactoylglutathione lyase family enzyme